MNTVVSVIGLGRMGANMVRRLMKDGHACVVYDHSADAVAALAKEGAEVLSFQRLVVGEGIEKKEDDFASEVMKQAGLA